MSAEFWAVIGVGVAVIALGWRMYSTLRADLGAMGNRIDALRGDMDTRFDAMGNRIDALSDRMGKVEQRLARIEGWIAGRFREEVASS